MASEAARLRRDLVRRLRDRGVLRTPRIAAAFERVPREAFLPGVALHDAYRDEAIVIKRLRDRPISSSSQPAMMAVMLEQLEPAEGMRILEIGTGSGYNAALLATIAGPAGRVVSVDLEGDLARAARERLRALGFGAVEIAAGDARLLQWPAAAFDRVLLTVAAREVLPAWFAALGPEGRIVLPMEFGVLQLSVAFDRAGERLVSRSCEGAAFMPLRGGTAESVEPLALGSVPGVALLHDRPLPLAQRAVWELLRGGGRREPLVPLDERGNVHDLGIWLDVRGAGLIALSAHGEAARRGLVPSAGEREAGYAMTFGLARADGFALLESGPPERMLMRAYGGSGGCAALRQAVADWVAAGRPSVRALHVNVEFEPRRAPPPAGTVVLERPHSTLLLRWWGETET